MSSLSRLVSLDLSGNYDLVMTDPAMRRLITNLTDLEELDLSGVQLTAVTPSSFMNFSASLTSLTLQGSGLQGKFPGYILQLPRLRVLDLSGNSLNGTLPVSNWSRDLVFLSLADCSFSGELPISIGKLPMLMSLDLSWNNFTGQIDFHVLSSLKNLRSLVLSGLVVSGKYAVDASHLLPKLETLDVSSGTMMNLPCILSIMPELKNLFISDCVLEEVSDQCSKEGAAVLLQLEKLDMGNCNSKKFPAFLSQSNKLRELYLNNNVIKEIPSWFWDIGIDTMETLDLENNIIREVIRFPWKRLTFLNLANNSFEGPLPTLAQSITHFAARQNHFEGNIPSSVCRLTSLGWLDLAQNNLTGIIPQCLGDLTALSTLNLSNNLLTGPLPESLVNCISLANLDVSHNHLNGNPAALLTPLSFLSWLSLQDNLFEGRWPIWTFLELNIGSIDISSNKFEGKPPFPSFLTIKYSISNNSFSGEIGSLICGGSNLRIADMSNNRFSGTLLECLKSTTTDLTFLNLRMNKLGGMIPEIFSERFKLRFLDLSKNQFEGHLPRSLVNCKQLELLNVAGNRIADQFPYFLQALPLKVLSLRSNRFYGSLNNSKREAHFSELRILDISDNKLDGHLPDNLITKLPAMMRLDNTYEDGGTPYYPTTPAPTPNPYSRGGTVYFHSPEFYWPGFYSVEINWKGEETEMEKINVHLSTLDLSSNQFRGEIPQNIGSLASLRGLNLSHNRLTGTIPPSLGNLSSLDSLDLSSNKLVGEIPKELTQLSFLGFLNLSQNNLTGKIPEGGHLNSFPNGSFEGNPDLCGIPLTRVCSKAEPPRRSSEARDGEEENTWGWSEWKLVGMGFGSGMVMGISMGYIVLETGRPLWLWRMAFQLEAKFKTKTKRKRKQTRGHRNGGSSS